MVGGVYSGKSLITSKGFMLESITHENAGPSGGTATPTCPPVCFSYRTMAWPHAPHLKGIMCYVDPTLIAEDEMSSPPLLQGGEVDLTDQGQLSWVEEWRRVS